MEELDRAFHALADPSRRAIVWVPLLMVLWANLHGSFVVGLGLLGIVLVGPVRIGLHGVEG